MEILAGTSGYAYKAWKGPFYPEDLPDTRMLEFYAGQLPAVEVNNTFYRMPTLKSVERWEQASPESFRFVLKMTRRVTHHAKLRAEDDLLEYLFGTTAPLGARLGAHLVQLPPYLRVDLEALEGFLSRVPEGHRVALEFRHVSWFTDDVFDLLRRHDAALVLADGGKVEVPEVATASWGYLRLRRDRYDEGALAQWAERIAAQPWERAYVFFKHEDDGGGPRMARSLLDIMDGTADPQR